MVSSDSLQSRLAAAQTADTCLDLAAQAAEIGAPDLVQAALEQAIALDRDCQPALLNLAAQSLDEGQAESTRALLEEAGRIAPLPAEIEPLRAELAADAGEDSSLGAYLRTIGRLPTEPAERPLSFVLVTNLFPPHELGGYGRMMWEFAHGLLARGHRVRILTANAQEFAKPATADEVAMEREVLRTLELVGTWVEGRPMLLQDQSELMRRLRDNAARLRTAVTRSAADVVLVGNLDLLGLGLLRHPLGRGVPILHLLANRQPGYLPEEQPLEPHYWVAPCSDWNGDVFRDAGFAPARVETVYPGARVDRFYRLFLPDTRGLRICYASLVLPYKGADTLVDALCALHRAGVPFTAEIAGDAPDPQFLRQLRETVAAAGLTEQIRFTGFLDRARLAGLFARNNVLVFPSRFDEPFGISQVEAMSAGLVVVSSGTGGAKEIVRDGIDGLLFTPGDANDLAAKLRWLADDLSRLAKLQRPSQARAVAFSVDNSVRKIETLAGEMLAEIASLQAEELPPLAC